MALGLPAEGIALVIWVDRILDMSHTAINVTGDITACVVMDQWLSVDAPVDVQEKFDSVVTEAM